MVDFLGNELELGDRVVGLAHQRTSSTLFFGVIERFTNTKVIVKTFKKENDWRYRDKQMVDPIKIVKVTGMEGIYYHEEYS